MSRNGEDPDKVEGGRAGIDYYARQQQAQKPKSSIGCVSMLMIVIAVIILLNLLMRGGHL